MKQLLLLQWIILLYTIVKTHGQNKELECFMCSAIGDKDNHCEDYSAYKKAHDNDIRNAPTGTPVRKKCTSPYNKSCMVEQFVSSNGEKVQIRDCSDDKTFDFIETHMNASSYSRLLQLQDNNETACAYDGSHLVCLSKCGPGFNYTDLCNGPQFGHAVVHRVSFPSLTFIISVLYLLML